MSCSMIVVLTCHPQGRTGKAVEITTGQAFRPARAMDGDLTVESAPGQGARFTLSVPAAEDLREKPR